MKCYYTVLIILLLAHLCYADAKIDTINKNKTIYVAIEHPPEYPGGFKAFSKYISSNLQYPEVAKLIGINGKIILTFVINRDGKVVEATPVNCIGAGCEAEAVKVLEMSKPWMPGIQKGRAVRVQYSIPINFDIEKGKVKMKELRGSQYGFVFDIKDKLYTLDEAQTILGSSFESEQIMIAEPFYNSAGDDKFVMPSKKEVYVIRMKG